MNNSEKRNLLISNHPDLKKSILKPIALKQKNTKIVGIHFPQFHQIPENDKFWGEGFTEWTLLRNAKRTKDIGKYNHEIRKPHPDIGYYDLSHKRKKQADLAKGYGVDLFMYYHYWFGGQKVMYKVPEAAANQEEPNLPFFLCWANEPWNRIWTGESRSVLLAQDYGEYDDWLKHYNYLDTLFKSSLYYKVAGKPVIAIYRPGSIPKLEDMLKTWRELATATYGGLFVISTMIGHGRYPLKEIHHLFDAFYLFEPHYSLYRNLHADKATDTVISMLVAQEIIRKRRESNHFLGVFTHWDNTPRYSKTPEMSSYYSPPDANIFKKMLIAQLVKTILSDSPTKTDDDLIFIAAWNEWNEGAVLEPSIQDGYKFLEANRDAKRFITKTF